MCAFHVSQIVVVGCFLAYQAYMAKKATGDLLTPEQKATNPVYQGSLNLWYIDSAFTWLSVGVGGKLANISRGFDKYVVDGLVTFVAYFTGFLSEAFRRVQTGYVRNYALMMLFGVIAVIGGLLYGAHSLLAK